MGIVADRENRKSDVYIKILKVVPIQFIEILDEHYPYKQT